MTQENHRRLYQNILWKSRRGMLELDLLLGPFVRDIYLQLNDEQQRSYQSLLTLEDTELHQWLSLGQTPDNEFTDIVTAIVAYAQRPSS